MKRSPPSSNDFGFFTRAFITPVPYKVDDDAKTKKKRNKLGPHNAARKLLKAISEEQNNLAGYLASHDCRQQISKEKRKYKDFLMRHARVHNQEVAKLNSKEHIEAYAFVDNAHLPPTILPSDSRLLSIRHMMLAALPKDNNEPFLAFDKDGRFLFAKVDRANVLRNEPYFEDWRHTLEDAFKVGRVIERGEERASFNSKYTCHGYRRGYEIGQPVGKFVPKKNADPKLVRTTEQRLTAMLFAMQEQSSHCICPVDQEIWTKQRSQAGIPTFGDNEKLLFSSMAIGINYWSGIHTDKDIFYSMLSVLPSNTIAKQKNRERVLQYFVFPSTGHYVPMSAGDILIFNPAIPHGSSPPMEKDIIIYSAYANISMAVAATAESSKRKRARMGE